MKKISNFSLAFTLIIFLVSCQKDISTAEPSLTADGKPSKGPSISLPIVPLKVTVLNDDGSGNQFRIRNDGTNEYENGVDDVEAILDQSGSFAFNTFKPSTRDAMPKRYVIYDFSDPVDPTNTYRPNLSTSVNYHFSTGPSKWGTNPMIPIQNLGINGNASTECIYMGNGLSGWRVSFHKGYEDTENSPTSFAVVTRTKVEANDGVDEWVIQPVGACSVNSNVAALRSGSGTRKDPEVLHGYYNLPFRFILNPL